jgi:hypothetical protein
MRALRLARVAAEAEVLRLRRRARRTALRAAFAIIASVFAFAALCFAHVAVFMAIRHSLGSTSSALIVLGADLGIALACVLVASISSPDRIELEALQVRERALQQVEEMLATAAVMAPLARLLGRPRIFGVVLALVVPRLLAALRR